MKLARKQKNTTQKIIVKMNLIEGRLLLVHSLSSVLNANEMLLKYLLNVYPRQQFINFDCSFIYLSRNWNEWTEAHKFIAFLICGGNFIKVFFYSSYWWFYLIWFWIVRVSSRFNSCYDCLTYGKYHVLCVRQCAQRAIESCMRANAQTN